MWLKLFPSIAKWSDVLKLLSELDDVRGVAIDAPLIITILQASGTAKESSIREYSRRYAGAHPSNLSLYPDADAVKLSAELTKLGYVHCNIGRHTFK